MTALERLIPHAPKATKHYWVERLTWTQQRHPFQHPPPGYWYAWMLRSGRGTGKTRAGAEDVTDWCWDHPGHRYAIVAPTYGDARDIAMEGESGVLTVAERKGMQFDWNRSMGEMTFSNGARVHLYSAEKPNRLRGPQFHRAWLDELASFKDAPKGDAMHTTFNNLALALRLGDDPRMIITTTPRNNKLIRELADRPDVVMTSGSTADNADNLAAPFLRNIMRYEGTRIGRQELHGEILEDIEGAIWTLGEIDRTRIREQPPALRRVVVGVDPPGGLTECGIVTAAAISKPCPCGHRTDEEHYAVLRDDSLRASPRNWARAVTDAFDETDADQIVAETNYGGDMVRANLRTERPNLPVRMVRATRGKRIRAEPIHTLYEQGRVHHVGTFVNLEEEMTTWVPPDHPDASAESPNRIDALVWALTALARFGKREWKAY